MSLNKNTAVYQEAMHIKRTGSNDVTDFVFNLNLHTSNGNIPVRDVTSYEVFEDYHNNIADYILVSFIMDALTYVRKFKKYENELLATVEAKLGDSVTDIATYKFIPLPGKHDPIGTDAESMSDDDLSKANLITVEGQCLLNTVDVLRVGTYNNSLYDITPTDAIICAFKDSIRDIIVDGKKLDVDVDIHPSNGVPLRHIVIPSGTNILDIPSWMQNTEIGVYRYGLGSYLTKRGNREILFVYPLYRNHLDKTERDDVRELYIYSINDTNMKDTDNTYLVTKNAVKIVSNGDESSHNDGQMEQLNSGTGWYQSNVTDILKKNNISITDNKLKIKKGDLVGTENIVRKDGSQYIKKIPGSINSKIVESQQHAGEMSQRVVTWQYSNPTLIHPGMNVIYVTVDGDDTIHTRCGVVQGMFSSYNTLEGNCMSTINVLIEKQSAEERKEEDENNKS